MKTRSIAFALALALATPVALVGCGNQDQPLTQAQLERRMQEQQLQAQRDALNNQNAMAREQLRQAQVQTQAMQQQMMPAQPVYQQPVVQQPVYTTSPQPMQQPVVVDNSGISTGTAVVGAAAAAGLGYMAGKASAPSRNTTTIVRDTSYNKVVPAAPARTYTQNIQPAKPTLNLTKSTPTYKASVPSKPRATFTSFKKR